MRGFKTAIIAAVLVGFSLVGGACSGGVQSSDPVTPSGGQSARNYLATVQPNQPAGGSQQLPAGWQYGIVMSTTFEKHYPISSNQWAMTIQKGDGTAETFSAWADEDALNAGVHAGDYVAFNNKADKLVAQEDVRVITVAAVPVNK